MAVSVSSTSIRLTWRVLRPEEKNGIIRSYRISVTELETGSVLNFIADETATQQIVNSLHPFYNYRCTVAAFTVGLGPSATTDVQTLPEGSNPIESQNPFTLHMTFFLAAPSDVPQNITIDAINASIAQLTWEPPTSDHRNGIIEAYIIKVLGLDDGVEFELTSNTHSTVVFGLHPFYRYQYSIAAQTIALGPFSNSITYQMPEAGNLE